MYIKSVARAKQAWTLVEMMVAVAIFSLCGLTLMGLYMFSVKSMASMYSYALLDAANRQAMDQLTREIRQAKKVLSFSTNSITLRTADTNGVDGPAVTYLFSPGAKKMLRTSEDGTTTTLLDNCSLLSFQLYTRCPISNTFGIFPVATNNWQQTVKVLQLTWKTSIIQPSGIANSENVQTARIVLRKQQES
jgi:prepilin-type N-terminal cleavage/methylation domain-containing protein